MKAMRRLVIAFAFLFAAMPAFAAGVSDLPPAIQVRQYLVDLAEAGKKGDNAKIIELCEKMLALQGAPVDAAIHFYYAKSLAAVGRESDAYREVTAFLQSPNPDSELVDEALQLRKTLQNPMPTRIPYLGISIIPLNDMTREAYSIPKDLAVPRTIPPEIVETGVIVTEVDPKGAGRRLKVCVVITNVGGMKVTGPASFAAALKKMVSDLKNGKNGDGYVSNKGGGSYRMVVVGEGASDIPPYFDISRNDFHLVE